MRLLLRPWIPIFALLASSTPLGAAQAPDSTRPAAQATDSTRPVAPVGTLLADADSAAGGFCLRGGPLPRCGSFLIAEYGVGVGVDLGSGAGGLFGVTAQLGWMVNRGDGTARGGAAMLVWEGHRLMLGGAYRHRRWLKDWLALDLAPGIVTSIDGKRGPIPVGVIGHAAVSAGDLVSAYAQIQTLYIRDSLDGDTVPVRLVIGVSTGSYLAVTLGAATGALAWWASGFD